MSEGAPPSFWQLCSGRAPVPYRCACRWCARTARVRRSRSPGSRQTTAPCHWAAERPRPGCASQACPRPAGGGNLSSSAIYMFICTWDDACMLYACHPLTHPHTSAPCSRTLRAVWTIPAPTSHASPVALPLVILHPSNASRKDLSRAGMGAGHMSGRGGGQGRKASGRERTGQRKQPGQCEALHLGTLPNDRFFAALVQRWELRGLSAARCVVQAQVGWQRRLERRSVCRSTQVLLRPSHATHCLPSDTCWLHRHRWAQLMPSQLRVGMPLTPLHQVCRVSRVGEEVAAGGVAPKHDVVHAVRAAIGAERQYGRGTRS